MNFVELYQISQQNKQITERIETNNKFLIDLKAKLSDPACWNINNGVPYIIVFKYNRYSRGGYRHYLTNKDFKNEVTKILNELKIYDFCIKFSVGEDSIYHHIYLKKISMWSTIFYKSVFNCGSGYKTGYYYL